jgi:excinuclease ABC subunit A
LSVKEALQWLDALRLTEKEATIAHQILKEIRNRLQFLIDVGLDYLTLDREASTLAGGARRNAFGWRRRSVRG